MSKSLLKLENLFCYKVLVKYKKGYFDNPNTPRKRELLFSSTRERDKDYIQNTYKYAVVLDIELIGVPKNF